MPVIKRLAQFTESFVFYGIEFSGYKNIIQENGAVYIPYIFYSGYKNMFLDSEYRL